VGGIAKVGHPLIDILLEGAEAAPDDEVRRRNDLYIVLRKIPMSLLTPQQLSLDAPSSSPQGSSPSDVTEGAICSHQLPPLPGGKVLTTPAVSFLFSVVVSPSLLYSSPFLSPRTCRKDNTNQKDRSIDSNKYETVQHSADR
jgi:hypothetical protein